MDAEEEQQTRQAVGKGDDEAIALIQQKIEKYGGIERAERIMAEYIDSAKKALSLYPASEYRTALEAMCDFLAQRKK